MSNFKSSVDNLSIFPREGNICSEFLQVCKLLKLSINYEKNSEGSKASLSLVTIWKFSALLSESFSRYGDSFFTDNQCVVNFLARIGIFLPEPNSFSFLACRKKIFKAIVEEFFRSLSLFEEIADCCDIKSIFYLRNVFDNSLDSIDMCDQEKFQTAILRLCFAFFVVHGSCLSSYEDFCNSIFDQIGFGWAYFEFFIDYKNNARLKLMKMNTILQVVSSYILTVKIPNPRGSVAFHWAFFYGIKCAFETSKRGEFTSVAEVFGTMKMGLFYVMDGDVLQSWKKIRVQPSELELGLLIENFNKLVSSFLNFYAESIEIGGNSFFGSENEALLNDIFSFEKILFGVKLIDGDRLNAAHFERALQCVSQLSEVLHFDSYFFFRRWGIYVEDVRSIDGWHDFAISLFKSSANVVTFPRIISRCQIQTSLFGSNFLPKTLWGKLFLSEEEFSNLEYLRVDFLLSTSFDLLERFLYEENADNNRLIYDFLESLGIEVLLNDSNRPIISIHELYKMVLSSLFLLKVTSFSVVVEGFCSLFNYNDRLKFSMESRLSFPISTAVYIFSIACKCKRTALECLFFAMGFGEKAVKELFSEIEASNIIKDSCISGEFKDFFFLLISKKVIALYERGEEVEHCFNRDFLERALIMCAISECARLITEMQKCCLNERENNWSGNWWKPVVYFVDQLYEDERWPRCDSINYAILLNAFNFLTCAERSESWFVSRTFKNKYRAMEGLYDITSKQQLFNALFCKSLFTSFEDHSRFAYLMPLNFLDIYNFLQVANFSGFDVVSPIEDDIGDDFRYGSMPYFNSLKLNGRTVGGIFVDIVRETLFILYGVTNEHVFIACLTAIGFDYNSIITLRKAQLVSFQEFLTLYIHISKSALLFQEKIMLSLQVILEEELHPRVPEFDFAGVNDNEQQDAVVDSQAPPEDNDEREPATETLGQQPGGDIIEFDQQTLDERVLGI